jgi:hypothetical protein
MSKTEKPAEKKAEAKPAAEKAEAKSAEKKAEPETKPVMARLGSNIKNAPVVHNTGGFELRVIPLKSEAVRMAGHNNGVQESGTH